MTKLYHGPEGQGWQIPGQQDRKAARIDVPSSPAELAAWLNERHVWAAAREIDREQLGFTGENPDLTIEDLERLGEGDAAPYILGPKTKDPPRLAPAFLGDLESGAEFVPVAKAAEIDRLLARCPKCHGRATAHVLRWIFEASIDDLQTVAEAIGRHVHELGEQLEGVTFQ